MNFRRLAPVFQRHQLLFAYLFGSHAKGNAIPRSDVDIAAYFSSRLSLTRLSGLRLSLATSLTEALGRDDLDLVILNEAPPSWPFRPFNQGRSFSAGMNSPEPVLRRAPCRSILTASITSIKAPTR